MPPPILLETPRMTLTKGKMEAMRIGAKAFLRRLFNGPLEFRNLSD